MHWLLQKDHFETKCLVTFDGLTADATGMVIISLDLQQALDQSVQQVPMSPCPTVKHMATQNYRTPQITYLFFT